MTADTATIHHAEAMPGARMSASILTRIRAEYQEMPGLTLTIPQAALIPDTRREGCISSPAMPPLLLIGIGGS
jgi:hypothetical protein